MFGWFIRSLQAYRRTADGPNAAFAMVGAKSSDEVLVLGARDLSLAADIGAVTRLNGRTVIVGEAAGDEARVNDAANRAGALLEFVKAPLTPIPFAAGTFHILVVPDFDGWPPETRGPRLNDAIRVLRPGGRVILLIKQTKQPASKEILDSLSVAGFSAARRLAEAEGTEYYEARKSRE